METYYKLYSNTKLDESQGTVAFIIISDGEKHAIAFPNTTSADTIEDMQSAIGSRISAMKEFNKDVTPAEILDSITYNMMFITCSDEDEAYESWEDAAKAAEATMLAYSYDFMETEFKLYEPIMTDFSENDTMTEEK